MSSQLGEVLSKEKMGSLDASAPEGTAHLRFEVLVNGVVKCVVGVEEFGVLSAIVGWVKRSPDQITPAMRARPGFDEEEFLAEEVSLSVTGLDSPTDHHVQWLERSLIPGDVVTIRVLGVGAYDLPVRNP